MIKRVPTTITTLIVSSIVFTGHSVAAIQVGLGSSNLPTARRAGHQAASQAKSALGQADVKLVLVFDNVADDAASKRELMAGVGQVFPKERIFGCSAYSTLTTAGNSDAVGVLALGGDVKVAAASTDLNGGQESSGKAIGTMLAEHLNPSDPGRLLILLGACTVPRNKELLRGVQSVFGQDLPIVGGAASRGQYVYAGGYVLRESNLGILLTGEFELAFAGGTAPSRTADEVIEVGGRIAEQALKRVKDRTVLALVCNCAGRFMEMDGRHAEEFQGISNAAAGAPLFGFYSNGEIGHLDNESCSQGVGHHIMIAAILTPKAKNGK